MKSKLFYLTLLTAFLSNAKAQIPGAKVGSFDQFIDIGTTQIKGFASYQEPLQAYRLIGSGMNIWFGHDSFSFLSKKITGDFVIQAQLSFVGDGHEPHGKAGLMIRTSTAANSPVVA
ncbi:hypothetical protein ACRQ5D_21790 [Mucilaginibacter sp. P25]|uniref:Uncharacterized protein n=1 Tax=Mucilaginibacter gossypii TaxID=551996 RepID=A0A1G7YP14_9SPHI|nr:hypothetical protein [Mucilaginibacter gossypii]SDG98253.1 hypothetical protein SAMN05192573_10610 [Mucilaginibacter gossypii]